MSSPTVLFDAPGPRGMRRNRVITVVGWVAIAAFVVALGWRLRGEFTAAKVGPFVDPAANAGTIWTTYLLPGLLNTLIAAAVSVVLALILGLLLGCGRLSPWRWVSAPCGVLVEFFRAVPVLLMMIFSWYFYIFVLHLPSQWQSFAGVVTGLTLYNGAVIAELVRSGVHGLPRGQAEAGLAIGMTTGQVLASIQLPQAITAMLPALVSQLVVILKDTALGTAITYTDLLQQGSELSTWKGNIIATFTLLAVFYIVLNVLLSRVAGAVETRLRRSRRGPSASTLAAVDQEVTVAAAESAAHEPR